MQSEDVSQAEVNPSSFEGLSGRLSVVAQKLEEEFPAVKDSRQEFRGELTYTVDSQDLVRVCVFCKERLRFNMLLDISSIDYMGEDPRFEVVYELYSLDDAAHLRLRVFPVTEDDVDYRVPSVVRVWATANWHEREVYDMMGIRFDGHPDLRRILMWDGFPYFPLRKDFPLEGKASEVPDTAFSAEAPLEGGPFVAPAQDATRQNSEPRAKRAGWDADTSSYEGSALERDKYA